MNHVEFIEPFGLIYLYWLIRDLLDRGASKVLVELPDSLDVRNYLVRMHFPAAVSDLPVGFRPPIEQLQLSERDLADKLLEVSIFELKNDDQVEDLTQRIFETIVMRGKDLEISGEYLRLGLGELLSNIESHSQSREAIVTVQRYNQRVQIAVGDGGIGIPAALEGRLGTLSDAEMVLRALDPHVSSRIGRGGLGLPMIVEAVREHGGYLGIRSGAAHVYAGDRGISARESCSPLPGTLVEIVWDPRPRV
ncbi:MAG TPA: ATP-binding protein [Gemmatimonadota bacterium]|nr:ATP-binding protein [Gemmatimonadota bacterium]